MPALVAPRRTLLPGGQGGALALTLAGNEITDVTRVTGTQGDGRAPDGSYGVWRATTNLCTNGGATTNTTGWGDPGSKFAPPARSTEQAKFGTASFKCVCDVADVGGPWSAASFAITLTAALHFYSAWLYIPTAWTGGQITIDAQDFTGMANASANANMSLRDQWQRVSVSFTPLVGDLLGTLYVNASNVKLNEYLYVDGVQCEANPLATPYVETDGGTAARAAGRIQVPTPTALLKTTRGWFALRMRMGFASTAYLTKFTPFFFYWADDATHRYMLWLDSAGPAGTWSFSRTLAAGVDAATQQVAFAADDIVTLVCCWDTAAIRISVNGAAFTTTAGANVPTLAATTLDIGSAGASATNESNADLLWAMFGTGSTLSNAATAHLHSFGNNDPQPGIVPREWGVTALWDGRTGTLCRLTN